MRLTQGDRFVFWFGAAALTYVAFTHPQDRIIPNAIGICAILLLMVWHIRQRERHLRDRA